jgi:magnesium-transporting ATPase (P-type)
MVVRRLNAVESLGSTTVICVRSGSPPGRRGARPARPRHAPHPDDRRALDGEGRLQTTGSATEAALLVAAHAWGVDAAALRERHPRLVMSPRVEGRNWMGLHGVTTFSIPSSVRNMGVANT